MTTSTPSPFQLLFFSSEASTAAESRHCAVARTSTMSKFDGEAGAGLVFMILYFGVFSWLLFAYLTHRIKWRSRWSILFFHVMVRLASQACGMVSPSWASATQTSSSRFSSLAQKATSPGKCHSHHSLANQLTGITQVLCAFRFIISWHQHNLPGGISWLEPRREAGAMLDKRERIRRTLAFLFLGPFALLFYRDNIMAAFHIVLILANSAIIVGGSFLANADFSQFDSADTQHKLLVSRTVRTAGQSVFLACNGAVHPTLVLLLIAWIPLIVRGTYGVLQSADFALSYYNPSNYGLNGFTAHYTLVEYLMGVTTSGSHVCSSVARISLEARSTEG
ncbi:hypothetical protein B0H13DRAFT_2649496 [Mycena leptocephala]|nr:hypothetical protein B0H13DRAFT_2649496 [Mycena leptocephala]